MRILPWLCLALWLGCDGTVEREPAPFFVQAESIEWETQGGGDLRFDVRRGESGSFVIRVARRDFRVVDANINLTREESLPVSDLVARVFDGKESLSGSESDERGETGTWTSVCVVDREKQRHQVASSHLRGELRALRYWVEDQLSALAGPPEPLQ